MDCPVSVESLVKVLGGKRVLDGLAFTLERGKIAALLGPNGAGKTTLIGCILGLLEADEGSVRLWGENVAALRPETRGRIGFVPQTMTGLTWFRVGELMDYLAAYRGRPDDVEDRRWWDWAGIDPVVRVKSLSGGERQRLAIVLALRFSPDLVILDEPVASLDPQARYDFMRLLPDYVRRSGACVLISSHIISDLEDICDRFLMMRKGRMVLDIAAGDVSARVRRLAVPPDERAGLEVLAEDVGGGFWVRGWSFEHESAGLEVLPGDVERLFLALMR